MYVYASNKCRVIVSFFPRSLFLSLLSLSFSSAATGLVCPVEKFD